MDINQDESNLFNSIRVDNLNLYIGKTILVIGKKGAFNQIVAYFKSRNLDEKFKYWVCNKYRVPEYKKDYPMSQVAIDKYEKNLLIAHKNILPEDESLKCKR